MRRSFLTEPYSKASSTIKPEVGALKILMKLINPRQDYLRMKRIKSTNSQQ